jgi:hypothetical protein
LQIEHDPGKFLPGDLGSPKTATMPVGNLPILAERTGQIALHEKDGSAAACTHQEIFLAKVKIEPAHPCPLPGTAESFLILQTIDPALSGADSAFTKPCKGDFSPCLQFPGFMKSYV